MRAVFTNAWLWGLEWKTQGCCCSSWSVVFVLCLGIIPRAPSKARCHQRVSSSSHWQCPWFPCLSPCCQGRCRVSCLCSVCVGEPRVCHTSGISEWHVQGVPRRVLGTPGLRRMLPVPSLNGIIASAEALQEPLQLPQINYSLIITQTLWIREQGWQGVDGRWSNLDCN